MVKLRTAWEKFKQTKFYRSLKEYAGLDDLIAIIITLIGGLYYWKNGPLPYHAGWHTFYERIHVELIGIGITVLILGNTNQAIRTKQEKRRLILQMGSPDNGFAREAVRQLMARGWLYDGTLTLMKTDLARANLAEAALDGVHMAWVCLMEAHLEKADLREAHLEGAILWEAHLEGADLSGANLEWAALDGAHMAWVCLMEAHLEKADLKGVHLEEADLWGAHLEGADLSGANLEWADMDEVNLKGADLWKAHLEGAVLSRAHLEGADLYEARLEGAVLKHITYNSSTIWTGAKYNKTTQWPEGFDPEAAGCDLVEN